MTGIDQELILYLAAALVYWRSGRALVIFGGLDWDHAVETFLAARSLMSGYSERFISFLTYSCKSILFLELDKSSKQQGIDRGSRVDSSLSINIARPRMNPFL